jgi:hypothetical protein
MCFAAAGSSIGGTAATGSEQLSTRHQFLEGNPMNEILLIFSTGVVAGIVIGILLVHD